MITTLQLQQRTALGACIGIGALVAFTFLYACTQWYGDWKLAHQIIDIKPTLASSEATSIIANLPNTHIFGQSLSAGNMPITSLQLRVTGIVKIDDEQNGSSSKAYISMSGQPSKIYQAGDSLPYGVKIYSITPDAVILENDGKLEKLPLPREPLQFKPRDTEDSAE